MNIFYLARHGQTLNNRDKRLSGWVDTPLTEEGLAATRRAVEKLRDMEFDAVYASDLGRAFITAYVISNALGLGHEIIRKSGLREVNYGDAAHMYTADAYSRYPLLDRDTTFVPPNGHSLQQMQGMLLDTMIDIDQAHEDKTVLIVAHSGVMAALDAEHRDIDFGGHNISEAFEHDTVIRLTMVGRHVSTFDKM